MDNLVDRVMFCVGVVGVISLFLFIGGVLVHKDWKDAFMNTHTKTPFCVQESATVGDKTLTLIRCWKTVELTEEEVRQLKKKDE